MKDISYHILDIVQNSLHACATRTEISVRDDSTAGTLELKIIDNGIGMPEEVIRKVTDPFYTTSVTKKVGLGLPLLKQNAEQTGGTFSVESVEKKGTTVTAVFNRNHIDMIPEGNQALTMKSLIAANPGKDFVFRYSCNRGAFDMDTDEIRKNLDVISINTREVLDYIVDFIRGNLQELDK